MKPVSTTNRRDKVRGAMPALEAIGLVEVMTIKDERLRAFAETLSAATDRRR